MHAHVFIWSGILLLGQTSQVSPAPPRSRQVICRPCGETPPPKGYSCAAGAMVAASVPNKDIAATVAAACTPRNQAPNSTKSDDSTEASRRSQQIKASPGTQIRPLAKKKRKCRHWWLRWL